MLFDLKTGKRRRVVQIVFGFLAFIFFISFVGFGIGSDVSGGIFDAIGLGGGDGSSNPQYEQQIEDANETLETDPKNQPALLALAGAYFRSATETGVSVNQQTGLIEVTEEARADLEQSIDAWERYLATKPRRPDTNAAAQAAESYRYLLDADGAAKAQAIVAEAQGTSSAYAQLALYLYADGNSRPATRPGTGRSPPPTPPTAPRCARTWTASPSRREAAAADRAGAVAGPGPGRRRGRRPGDRGPVRRPFRVGPGAGARSLSRGDPSSYDPVAGR